MTWITEHWPQLLPLVLIAASVLWLMPHGRPRPKVVGLLLATVGSALLAYELHVAEGPAVEATLFSLLSVATILCAVLTITNHNPVYSALWFALATLSVCGLFLLQSAPFLAAATVIIYAGAIVVTFVFVIMLAQQSGATAYDQRARQPVVATLAAFALLGMILATLEFSRANAGPGARGQGANQATATAAAGTAELRAAEPEGLQITSGAGSGDPRTTTAIAAANPLSQVEADQPLGTMHGLGRSLFGDYLFAVELAGTLLLVATIGAIAIAPRRARGTL